MSATEPPKVVKRKCRYCGRTFKVPADYPKRSGCPDCAPMLPVDPWRPSGACPETCG